MHLTSLLQFIAASGLAVAPVIAAPTEELKGHTTLVKRTVFRGVSRPFLLPVYSVVTHIRIVLQHCRERLSLVFGRW